MWTVQELQSCICLPISPGKFAPCVPASARVHIASLTTPCIPRLGGPDQSRGTCRTKRPANKTSTIQSGSSSRTCKNCKSPFDPEANNPKACRFHTAHFGGETKRKFESVHTGGTMNTIGGGDIVAYWHCCGSKDPFDPGCEAAPHATYDD